MTLENIVFDEQVKEKNRLLFSSHLDLMFLETSAVTGENITESFLQCARKILSKIESG